MIKKIAKKFIPKSVLHYIKSREHHPLILFPHGHFYSPIISKKDIQEFEDIIWEGVSRNNIIGIDLNTKKQLELLESFQRYYDEIPFKYERDEKFRYCFNNSSYEYTDAIILYSFIRHFKPKRIIEIGSGFSSAVMLDTNDIFNLNIDISFIEPYPKLLYSLLRQNDFNDCKIYDKKVQSVPLEKFKELNENDILFIDSSHVSKTGSDVNFAIFNILTNLNSGVLIHFHDVFYPFEYPKEWVLEGRNWNEDYLLRAFLTYNNSFEILHFSQFIHNHHKEAFQNMPLTYKNTGGNLWIRKK